MMQKMYEETMKLCSQLSLSADFYIYTYICAYLPSALHFLKVDSMS